MPSEGGSHCLVGEDLTVSLCSGGTAYVGGTSYVKGGGSLSAVAISASGSASVSVVTVVTQPNKDDEQTNQPTNQTNKLTALERIILNLWLKLPQLLQLQLQGLAQGELQHRSCILSYTWMPHMHTHTHTCPVGEDLTVILRRVHPRQGLLCLLGLWQGALGRFSGYTGGCHLSYTHTHAHT
jgi:hypothetical protein